MLFKRKEIKRVKRLEIRLTKTEKHILETECSLLNIDLTEYIMKCAFSKPMRYWNTTDIFLQLSKIIDQQRDIHEIDKSNEDLQKVIMKSVAILFRDMPKRVRYKIPIDYVPKEGENKTARIALRLTESDWDKIKKKAEEANKSISEYVLLKALARPKSPEIIIQIETQLKHFQNMLSELISHSLLKSPIYLTVQEELLEYLKQIIFTLTQPCYIYE